MSEKLFKPSKLKKLLNLTEARSYKLKYLSSKIKLDQYLLLKQNLDTVSAKLVNKPHSGEIILWPGLHHENLNPLLEIITNGNNLYVFISPFVGRSLRDSVMHNSFIHHPKCFERKRMYVKDILKGLEYLHKKSFCLMNLCAENVQVCDKTDRAIISDFNLLSFSDELPSIERALSGIYLPPEFDDGDDEIIGSYVDMWCYGILCLQVFTAYYLPLSRAKSELLNGLNFDVLKLANNGSCLADENDICFKEFIKPFLRLEPTLRMCATEGLKSMFLSQPSKRLDTFARDYWVNRDKIEQVNSTHSAYSNNLKTIPKLSNRIYVHPKQNLSVTYRQKYYTMSHQQQKSNSSSFKINCSSKSLPPLRLTLMNLPNKSVSYPNLRKSSEENITYKIKSHDSNRSSSRNGVKYSVVSNHIKHSIKKNKNKNLHKNSLFRKPSAFYDNNSREGPINLAKSESNSTDSVYIGNRNKFFDPNIIDDSYRENIKFSQYLKSLDLRFKKSKKTMSADFIKEGEVEGSYFSENGRFHHNICPSRSTKTHLSKDITDNKNMYEKDSSSKLTSSHRDHPLPKNCFQDCSEFNTKVKTVVSPKVPETKPAFHANGNSPLSTSKKNPPVSVIITDCCPSKKNRNFKLKKSKKVESPGNKVLQCEGGNTLETNTPFQDESSDCAIEKPLLSLKIKKPKGTWSCLFCAGKVKWNKNKH